MTTTERLVLIRYYAKILVEHSLPGDNLHEIIDRMKELSREIKQVEE